jgi:ribonuclease-3
MAPRPDVGDTAEDERLAQRLGHTFTRLELLGQALAHRSWCSEHGGRDSNERLEFLGDAVLGLVVAEHTYRTYPTLSDGSWAFPSTCASARARTPRAAGPRCRSWPTPWRP